MHTDFSMQRTYAIARKEFLHIIRDPATLFFALFIPVLELFMLGYAIDTNVRFVRTVIFDACNTHESERLDQERAGVHRRGDGVRRGARQLHHLARRHRGLDRLSLQGRHAAGVGPRDPDASIWMAS